MPEREPDVHYTRDGKIARNYGDGEMLLGTLERGWVYTSVREAFSWLPPAVPPRLSEQRDAGPQPPSGNRCASCVFQEPEWSQGHANCSHSWLHDHDDDCRAYHSKAEVISQNPGYAQFCPVTKSQDWPEELVDVFPGWKRWDDLHPSCNFPSHYCAMLNLPGWYSHPAVQAMYQAVDRERFRRFYQWAKLALDKETQVERSRKPRASKVQAPPEPSPIRSFYRKRR